MSMMSVVQICVVLALLSTLSASTPVYTCPPREDLTQCTCKGYAYGVSVTCSGFSSSELASDFKILKDHAIQTVLLYQLNITDVLPAGIFTGMKIQEITVKKCQLKFSQPVFTGLDESLHRLNLVEKSTIKSQDSLGKFTLAKLSKLNELYVKNYQMVQVSDKWLNGKVPNVEKVVLDENDISTIDSHAFSTLHLLRELSLSENRITSVERSMLPNPAWYLRRIDLSFNELKTIPSDFFSGMGSLKEVVLTQNELTKLDETTWRGVWEQLNVLLLLELPIDCGPSLKWIKSCHKPRELKGTCASPADMKGQDLNEF